MVASLPMAFAERKGGVTRTSTHGLMGTAYSTPTHLYTVTPEAGRKKQASLPPYTNQKEKVTLPGRTKNTSRTDTAGGHLTGGGTRHTGAAPGEGNLPTADPSGMLSRERGTLPTGAVRRMPSTLAQGTTVG